MIMLYNRIIKFLLLMNILRKSNCHHLWLHQLIQLHMQLEMEVLNQQMKQLHIFGDYNCQILTVEKAANKLS
uniref:Putative ovule protein n=1 Tax=Solanum chacoense TaxID=4108 RepID=A0A0V0HB08_SOLCH